MFILESVTVALTQLYIQVMRDEADLETEGQTVHSENTDITITLVTLSS